MKYSIKQLEWRTVLNKPDCFTSNTIGGAKLVVTKSHFDNSWDLDLHRENYSYNLELGKASKLEAQVAAQTYHTNNLLRYLKPEEN